jgi:cbb3-type cytochrome oxidase subunit 3
MDWLVVALVVLTLAVCAVWAYGRYRRHARAAEARSRTALNRLLAEADELQQQKLREQGRLPEVDSTEP